MGQTKRDFSKDREQQQHESIFEDTAKDTSNIHPVFQPILEVYLPASNLINNQNQVSDETKYL